MADVKNETVRPDGLAQKIAYDLCMHKELRITLGQMEFLESAVVDAVNSALRQPDTSEGGGEAAEWQVEAACEAFGIAKTNWFDRSKMAAALRAASVSAQGEQKRYLKDGPMLRLVRMRFFRDLIQSERVKVYEAFGIDKDDLPSPLTLGIEQHVFNQLFVRTSPPPLNKSPNPEHVEGDVLSVGEVEVLTNAIKDAETWLTALVESADGEAAESVHEVVKTITSLKAAAVTLSSAQSSIQRAERERDIMVEIANDLRQNHPLHWKFDMIEKAEARAIVAEAERDEWTAWAEGLTPAEISRGQKVLADKLAAAEAQLEEARKALADAFDFLGGVDGAVEIREAILPFIASLGEKQDAE